MMGDALGGEVPGDCARPTQGACVAPAGTRPQCRGDAIALCHELLAAAGLTVGDLLWDDAMAQGREEPAAALGVAGAGATEGQP